jgi:hypothetical protein
MSQEKGTIKEKPWRRALDVPTLIQGIKIKKVKKVYTLKR